jgi:hypothetical protein
MPKDEQIKVRIPHIVIEAAEAIKTREQFKRGLTGIEVAGLVKGIVGELVTGNSQVVGNIPLMDVKILQGRAEVMGTIRVDKPIGASIGVSITLINALNGSNSIELGNLKVESHADNFIGSAALKALNIEKKARETLANPTDALKIYLTNELKTQGVRLGGIAMKFTSDDKFTILLRGSKI